MNMSTTTMTNMSMPIAHGLGGEEKDGTEEYGMGEVAWL